jgi:hypothetical protein
MRTRNEFRHARTENVDPFAGGLHFAPDGAGLLAFSGSAVQVWRDWLNEPARPVVKTGSALERAALAPGAAHAVLYLSGNSRTKVLDTATGKVS